MLTIKCRTTQNPGELGSLRCVTIAGAASNSVSELGELLLKSRGIFCPWHGLVKPGEQLQLPWILRSPAQATTFSRVMLRAVSLRSGQRLAGRRSRCHHWSTVPTQS